MLQNPRQTALRVNTNGKLTGVDLKFILLPLPAEGALDLVNVVTGSYCPLTPGLLVCNAFSKGAATRPYG
jgi:hypothetical protein